MFVLSGNQSRSDVTPEEAQQATESHIAVVKRRLGQVIQFLEIRACEHDASKLESPEAEMFQAVTENLSGLTYGSPEYEAQRQEMLGMALKHHYEHNRHHPEHFEDGVNGMNLIDLVEMFCDWLAATERHADGNIYKSIDSTAERLAKDGMPLDPQVVCLLRNTAKLFEAQKE